MVLSLQLIVLDEVSFDTYFHKGIGVTYPVTQTRSRNLVEYGGGKDCNYRSKLHPDMR